MTGGAETRTVKSVENAFEILEYLRDANEATVSEIADHSRLSPGSVHTHLATLKQRGYVVQEGDEYRLGPLLLPLGEHVRNKSPIYQAAAEQVERLAEETGECAHLVVDHDGRLVTLYEEFGENAVGTEYHTRKREEPIEHHHCTAVGKSILSRLPEERVADILDRHGMVQRTPNTITTTSALLEELETVREQGYAVNDEEQMVGIRAVGAPVTTSGGDVLGALSVSGPTSRLRAEDVESSLAEEIIRATNISEVNVNTITE
ncbi:IclR family transcriptional regulator [Halobacterium yunchengense]|uniref:IclR family transcriptional regulator n=1 Tax=Halobacterium yunchengense TaxID=3108497 RepID=UPI00300AB043